MALKKPYDDPIKEKVDQVFDKFNKNGSLKEDELMKMTSFQIYPSAYKDLLAILKVLGLKQGSGIRFVLTKFIRDNRHMIE